MGTHPIFESDFDCLTDCENKMSEEPRSQIVYDDPGSVTDIRKKFGAMTKPSFTRPRSVSGNKNERPTSRGSIGSRDSRGSIGKKTNPFASISEDWTKSSQVKRNPEAPPPIQLEQEMPPSPIILQETKTPLPVFTPTVKTPQTADNQRKMPQRKLSSSSSMFNFPVDKQNTDIIDRIAAVEYNPNNINTFEDAVKDFYSNVQRLDPTIVNPR